MLEYKSYVENNIPRLDMTQVKNWSKWHEYKKGIVKVDQTIEDGVVAVVVALYIFEDGTCEYYKDSDYEYLLYYQYGKYDLSYEEMKELVENRSENLHGHIEWDEDSVDWTIG